MIHTDGNPTVASRIEENRNSEELNMVAVELAKTLGFCHGFLGKKDLSWTDDFPVSEETLVLMRFEYLNENDLGKDLSDAVS